MKSSASLRVIYLVVSLLFFTSYIPIFCLAFFPLSFVSWGVWDLVCVCCRGWMGLKLFGG